MITDLKLLPQTKITARTLVGHAQITLENGPENLVVHVSGDVGGNAFSLPPKSISASSTAMAKAMVIGPALKTGLEYLGAKASEQPQGLPIEVTVTDGANEHTEQFALPLDLNALAQFQQLLTWVKTVSGRVRR